MARPDYDVIVAGGGIHGAGVAQAAAAAGYSVLLLEKTEIGGATSSKSSKLIHGGLRYLESFQFRLVRECLRERAILLRIAPDLVNMIPFYIPVYHTTTRRPGKIHLGLWLYKILGGFDSASFVKLPHRDWSQLDGLRQDQLQAVFRYNDAQTNDIELTRAVVRSAQSLGAELIVPAQVIKAEIQKDACVVHIDSNGTQQTYRCRVLVNTAGRWANQLLQKCEPYQQPLPVDYVQGAHIIINETPKRGVFYLEAPSDQRAVFVMPWDNKVMIGTTETKIDDPLSEVKPQPQECDYLLDVYNNYFSPVSSSRQIISSFAGVRVLPRSDAAIFSRNRETILLTNSTSKPRLISVFGGKLTAYRATAERILKCITKSLPARTRQARTDELPLTTNHSSS